MQDSPKAPDPYQTANAQTQSNLATSTAQQRMNMVDQSNPYGSLNYSETGTNPDGSPKFSASTSLSAPMQGMFDKSTGFVNNLLTNGSGALSGKPLDLSYNATTAALDKLNAARLDPQWAHNTDMQESKLAAQGLTPGMPGYDRAMTVFNQGKNDAYNSANLADYGLSSANAATEYNSQLPALGAVYGISKGMMPTFGSTPTTNVAGTNISGLIEDNYKQESANANAQNGQMAGLIGTGLGVAAAPFTGGASLGLTKMGGLFGGGSPSGYGTGR